ncbi:MAG: hypothetical protein RL521_893 [Bacteroidota bacterium]
MIKTIITLLLSVFALQYNAQDARAILDKTEKKYTAVKKFIADIRIQSNIPALKILPAQAKMKYTAPDQLEITSKSIIVLPKQGFREIQNIITQKSKYTAMHMGMAKINGKNCHLITLLPLSDKEDWIMAKIWVDESEYLILQSQTTTKSSGTLKVNYKYGTQKKWALPDQMTVEVDVQKFKIPKGVATDLHRNREEKNQGTTGTIVLDFSNYQINP